MPISASAKKALRSSQNKASLNRYRKSRIKAAVKAVSSDSISEVISLVDKGVKWGLYHANKAARLKSQLTKQFPTLASKTKADKPDTTKAVAKKTAKPAVKKVAAKPVAKKATAKTKASK